ncbi:transporter substrate-binding domain-containing protein [Acidisoma cladoniae]|jgi:polar amino acid transport system substrate-binding protein|uniref:transporter substrate-binding domain-containing protein n=1 Tax=Acidisoma cladoniae TaxID=3040935 RepID=UPI00254D5D5A|nr:transporter substrate-binding domain-containing protein [Acidisoma sp. PAMC 29798]
MNELSGLTRRRVLQTVALAAPAILIGRAAHAETTWDAVRHRGVLNTVTEMQFAPWDMIVDGTYAGANRDLIDAVGAQLKLKVAYNDIPWDGILPGVQAGRFDLCIAPVMATKERLTHFAFTNPIGAATSALIKRTDETGITIAADISGKIVGVEKGSHVVPDLQAYSKTLPKPVDIREYLDSSQAYADLASGRLDAVANSSPSLAYLAEKRPETFALVMPPFGKPTFLCWAARLQDTTLTDAINGALHVISVDGQVAAIQKKWFGVVTPLPQNLPTPLI